MTGATQTRNDADHSLSEQERIDRLLDEALKESFPASDAISITTRVAAIKKNSIAPRPRKSKSGK